MSSNEFKRATGMLVMEVVNSNPNGDPDRESDPRQRSNGIGEISPVSYKRKLRDIIGDHQGVFFQTLPDKFKNVPENFSILEERGRDRDLIKKELGDDLSVYDQEKFNSSKFVQKYWDARVFGNTFIESSINKGYIKTGVVVLHISVPVISVIFDYNKVFQVNDGLTG